MALRLLTWNVMHGRAVPGAGRDLLVDFTRALAGWDWDVALLQEVPPWWPPRLAASLDATARMVLTSRNLGRPARRAAAVRWPDLIKSSGGGANAILVRQALGPPAEHRRLRLCRWPERRWVHAVRLTGEKGWVANLHASVRHDARARAEAATAAAAVLAWSAGAPAILGGDFNVRGLTLGGFSRFGNSDVDYVFAAGGWQSGGGPTVHERGGLSDHAPLVVPVMGDGDQAM